MKLKCDILLSAFAFNFNLRRYTKAASGWNTAMENQTFSRGFNTVWGGIIGVVSRAQTVIDTAKVWRCRLTLSNPR